MAADVIPMRATQPVPISTHVIAVAGRTAIARLWDEGDAMRCRRCPTEACNVDENGLCSVLAERVVTIAEAPDYRFRTSEAGRDVAGTG